MNIKNIKGKKIWLFTVKYILNNIYFFIWRYFFNLKSYILYFFWFLKKRDYYTLNNNYSIIKDNIQIKTFAEEVKKACENINLVEIKEKMLNGNMLSENLTNSRKKTYSVNLYDYLDEKTKEKIINFAKSEKIISSAAKHLKIFPILSRIKLNYNIKNINENRGAMLWHRDGFGFKSFDIFISITDIHKDNGPLFISKENSELGVFYRFLGEKKNAKPGEGGKIENNSPTSQKLYQNSDSNIGKYGIATMIDSFSIYHAGGNCKNNDRIMLRISYQSCDSIDLMEQKNHFLFYEKIKKNEIDSMYMKHLFFYRSMIFKNKKIKELLLKFYRIAQYYQSI